MKSRFKVIVLSMAMILFMGNTNLLAAETQANERLIKATLNRNDGLMREAFEEAPETLQRVADNSVSFEIDIEQKTLKLDGAYDVMLSGDIEQVLVDDITGYVGVFEGKLSDGTAVITDATFTDSELFAVITVGSLGVNDPAILFYGQLTDTLGSIADKHSEEVIIQRNLEKRQGNGVAEYSIEDEANEADTDRTSIDTGIMPLVDAATKFQGYDTAPNAGYSFGVLSLFHADELRNQGVMTTYTKVNTKCTQVENYLKNVQGFTAGSLVVYADTFDISICGNNDKLHAVPNAYLPQNNTTTATLTIPVYAGEVLGVQTIDFQITMSSTSVTTSKYSPNSNPNSKVSWNIYQRYGWNPNTFDGGYATENGMVGEASYTYEGNVSDSFTTTMTATGRIRYEYQYTYAGSTMTLHLTTDEMSVNSSLVIVE